MAKSRNSTWNADKIVSISAISISFITLMIFIYQTNLIRKQNYLSILPYLVVSTTDNAQGYTYELNLKNLGVGPAIIESVTVFYKNKEYDLADYDYAMHKCLMDLDPRLDSLKSFSFSTLNQGLAIPANETYNIISVKDSQKDYKIIIQSLEHLLSQGLDYEIVFKSIQNERWKLHNNTYGPIEMR